MTIKLNSDTKNLTLPNNLFRMWMKSDLGFFSSFLLILKTFILYEFKIKF